MATKLYLRSTTTNALARPYGLDLITTAGTAAKSSYTKGVDGGSEIQITAGAGAPVLQWISGRIPTGGSSISGEITFSLWGIASSISLNAGFKCRLFKRSTAGLETEIDNGFGSALTLHNKYREDVWAATPSGAVSFAEDERLVLKVYLYQYPTTKDMKSKYYGALVYDAAAASTGDSFIQLTETIAFKAE